MLAKYTLFTSRRWLLNSPGNSSQPGWLLRSYVTAEVNASTYRLNFWGFWAMEIICELSFGMSNDFDNNNSLRNKLQPWLSQGSNCFGSQLWLQLLSTRTGGRNSRPRGRPTLRMSQFLCQAEAIVFYTEPETFWLGVHHNNCPEGNEQVPASFVPLKIYTSTVYI